MAETGIAYRVVRPKAIRRDDEIAVDFPDWRWVRVAEARHDGRKVWSFYTVSGRAYPFTVDSQLFVRSHG